MKEMPKTVEDAVSFATQLEAIEMAQKKVCKQYTQELLVVKRGTKPWDGEAAAVKHADNIPVEDS